MSPIQIDSRFLSVVVHDLRNPLNVIGLSLRMIDEELPAHGCEDAREDLRIVQENINQLANMLTHLGDFARLIDSAAEGLSVAAIEPWRLAEETIAALDLPEMAQSETIRVEIAPSCPSSVKLDPIKSRIALKYALSNALAAANRSPIRLILSGHDGRLRIEVAVDRAPRPTIRSIPLEPDRFERLSGNEAERRGLDLAVVARVSELLGGSARLEVREGEGSSIVIDWPVEV